MITNKFNNSDRQLLIEEIEKLQGVKLERQGRSQRIYKSNNNLTYLIFGGTDNWHGVSRKSIQLLNDMQAKKGDNILLIAKKYRTQMDIYVGALSIFLSHQNELIKTMSGNLQFHCKPTEDGLYIEEFPEMICNKVHTIYFQNHKRNTQIYRQNAKLLNIEIPVDEELTHTDIQAKLLLIGSYLNYRTYTPDVSKYSEIYKYKLGEISTETKIPEESIPKLSIDTIKMIDVIWFDEEGYPTHAFEVEHTTDITKGLLRLYQTRKLRIKMFIISNQRNKFETEIAKDPFVKIKENFIFKNYNELEAFFESVKTFKNMKDKFEI